MSEVDEIKQRVDIVDLVSQYATLKRTGRTYTALCPFHTERTPSFHVDPTRQSWHCFGACGTGGDIFAFVMKKDGVEFREALRTLAERAGVSLESRRDPQEDTRRARMYDLNEAASAYFHAALANTEGQYAAKSQAARDYIAERHIADSSLELFQIGYAPNSWDALNTHLASRGFSQEEMVTAGLAVEGDRGTYDRFRHRLMFPIRDDRGRVTGFGGRVLPGDALGSGDNQPKYVNTSQSPIFDKGAILYALDIAKDAIRTDGQAVIVEGYMDVIAAHEHGYHNVVASMGTALTERQVALLKRHSSTLILSLDADSAGSEATIRGAYEIINNSLRRRPVPNSRGIVRQVDSLDIDLRVLSMPEGRDPDEVIRTSPELWPQLVAQAKPVLDHLFDVAATRHDLSQPRERSAAAAELTPIIALTADRVVQSHYMQRLARMVQVDEATLRLELRQPVRARAERAAEAAASASNKVVHDKREEFCLALLFRYPELRVQGEELDAGLFAHSENRALFETWIANPDTTDALGDSLNSDLRPQYERISATDLPTYDDDNLAKALRSAVWRIEQDRLRTAKRASAAVVADIAPARDFGEDAELAEAFVVDMEAGLKVHQRLLEQHDIGHKPRGTQ